MLAGSDRLCSSGQLAAQKLTLAPATSHRRAAQRPPAFADGTNASARGVGTRVPREASASCMRGVVPHDARAVPRNARHQNERMIRVRFAPSPTGYLHRRRPHGALQLVARETPRRRVRAAHRRHRCGTLIDRHGRGHSRRHALDGTRGGTKVRRLTVPSRRTSSRNGWPATARWPRVWLLPPAHYCYCTQDELVERRSTAEAAGSAWRYDRVCCALDADTRARYEREQRPRHPLLRSARCRTLDDQVHGPIEFDNANIEDFVILRSDGYPTYHLSVVADDVAMKMTHVVRGDDHIEHAKARALLYEAVGAPVPLFAHVPLILGTDKKRLSKRHGATSVMEHAKQGYLPEAMVNFLAAWLVAWRWRSRALHRRRAEGVRSARHRRWECRLQSGRTGSSSGGWRRRAGSPREAVLPRAAGLWVTICSAIRPVLRHSRTAGSARNALDEYPALGGTHRRSEWDEAAVKKHPAADGAGDSAEGRQRRVGGAAGVRSRIHRSCGARSR